MERRKVNVQRSFGHYRRSGHILLEPNSIFLRIIVHYYGYYKRNNRALNCQDGHRYCPNMILVLYIALGKNIRMRTICRDILRYHQHPLRVLWDQNRDYRIRV